MRVGWQNRRLVPPPKTYRRVLAAALCAIIGAVAGLLGIGGGELRLPVLVSFLALSVKIAITVNLAISVATLGTSLIRRWDSFPFVFPRDADSSCDVELRPFRRGLESR
jgi:hypothetical protein